MKEIHLNLSKNEMKDLLYKNTCNVLKKANEVKAGHIGGSLSMCQFLLPIIYFLEIEQNFDYKIILSKGHASLGLYSILNLLNINKKPFQNYCTKKSGSFHGHTCLKSFNKLISSSGSLGHGLPIAMGFAYTEKLKKSNVPVICILGDGELQEGTIWESLLHIFNMKLNVKILIDFNNSIETNTLKIDTLIKNIVKTNDLSGHSYSDINKAINLISFMGPEIIFFRTTKLANVYSYESKPQWHAGIPNNVELNDMLKKVSIRLDD